MMSDLLSVASLLLTILTVLFSIWITDFNKILTLEIKRFRSDREEDINETKSIFLFKALPLLIITVVIIITFFPEIYQYYLKIIKYFRLDDFFYQYLRAKYTLKMAYFAVLNFIFLFFIYILKLNCNLIRKWQMLEKKDAKEKKQ